MHKNFLLLGVLSLTGFVTSFGAYIVAANLPSYSRETGAGLIFIGFLIARARSARSPAAERQGEGA